MVVDDQQTRLRLALLLTSGFVVLWSLFWLASLIRPFPSLTIAQVVGYGAATGILLLLWTSVLFQRSRWRRLNAQRQAIAAGRGQQAWLAPPAPVRQERTLEVPVTIIALRPAWRGVPVWLGLFLLGSVVGSLAWSSAVPPGALIGGFLALLILVGGILASSRWPYRLEVWPDGLVVKGALGTKGAMRWQDAHIFVRWSWSRREGATHLYELASPQTTLRWRVLPEQRWWRLEQPVESWEAYEAQVATLRAQVEAATGLVLYDVGTR